VESGAQKILDAMDKGTRVVQIRDATGLLRHHGIRAAWFLQLGYPGETWEDILSTRDLVREERPDDVGVSVAYPLPGTLFYERVKEQLGARTHWSDSDDLAMMFRGTYEGAFYKRVRDLLHEEVAAFSATGNAAAEAEALFDARWADLAEAEASCRTDKSAAAPPALARA